MPRKQEQRSESQPVTFSLGGQTYELSLTMAVVADTKRHLGINLMDPDPKEIQRFTAILQDAEQVGKMVWVLLGSEDSGYTVREVERMLTIEAINRFADALTGVLTEGAPESGTEADTKNRKAAQGKA